MRFLVSALLVLACVSAHAASPQAPSAPMRADHPYLGTWTWTYKGCDEVYEYRADRTSKVKSGEEVGESTFTITDEPERSGFYHMVDTVTRSNGKVGCDGAPNGTPVGDVADLYVFIRPSGDEMLICQDESVDACIGPLRRVRH